MFLSDTHMGELLLTGKGVVKTELFSCLCVSGQGCDGGGTPELPWRSASTCLISVLPDTVAGGLHSICFGCSGLYHHPSPGGRGYLPTSHTFSSFFQGHELFFGAAVLPVPMTLVCFLQEHRC